MKFREVLLSLLDRFPPGTSHSTDHPCAFRVSNSAGIGGIISRVFSSNAEVMTGIGFVDALVDQLPFVLVWLGEQPGEDIRKYLQSQVASNDGVAFWTRAGGTSVQGLLDELYQGEWGMFFYGKPPERVPLLPMPLLAKFRGSEAAALLASTGATAAIMSYVDNAEWLVVCN